MKLEKLAPKPNRAGQYLVKLEDGTALRLYRQTVEDFGLYPGMELTEQELEALTEAAGEMSAKMRAVRIVAATSVSRDDLRQRLISKGEKPAQADRAVEWMEDLKLVDDEETARQIVSRCIAKGYGIARAKQALYEKRIPKSYWEAALADYPDQIESVITFLRQRLGADADQRERKRAIDALLRRGHSYGTIRQAMSHLDMDDEFPEE